VVLACDEVMKFLHTIRLEASRALCPHSDNQPLHSSGSKGDDDALAYGEPLAHAIRNQVGEGTRNASGDDHIRIEGRLQAMIRRERGSGIGHAAF
jgi:hypothetical protein